MLSAMAVLAVIGTLLHGAPYLFWNMTEKDQEKMIEDLKRRAHDQNVLDGCADASVLSSDEHLNDEELFDSDEKAEEATTDAVSAEQGGSGEETK